MKNSIFNIAILFLATWLINSCNDSNPKKQKETGLPAATAIELDTRLKDADSLVVVFYKDPYGEDSLRYTRFYTQVSVNDSRGLATLQKDLRQTFSGQEKKRNCRGEGKIWCFTNGKVFQTIYFSTRCDDCCHLYLIKDGNFYYSPVTTDMTAWLAELKPLSTEPANGGSEE